MLIVFAGLPGVGKSTLAQGVAERVSGVYLRIDSIEDAMAASTLAIHPAEDAGYLVGYAVAEDNLRLDRTVIADSVNPIDLTRAAWRDVATRAGRAAFEVEVICSDTAEHERRVEARRAASPTERWPNWHDVLDREYHAWTRDRLVVDTALLSVNDGVEAIVRGLSA